MNAAISLAEGRYRFLPWLPTGDECISDARIRSFRMQYAAYMLMELATIREGGRKKLSSRGYSAYIIITTMYKINISRNYTITLGAHQ